MIAQASSPELTVQSKSPRRNQGIWPLYPPVVSFQKLCGLSHCTFHALELGRNETKRLYVRMSRNTKIEKAKALGADYVINYREDRFEGRVRKITKKKGVDVVFEHVGADTWAGSMFSLKKGGRLVTCGSTSGVSTQVNLMMLFQQQLKLLGSFGCRMGNMKDAMLKMSQGLVEPVIDTEVDMENIHKALERMEGRKVFGKIVLKF